MTHSLLPWKKQTNNFVTLLQDNSTGSCYLPKLFILSKFSVLWLHLSNLTFPIFLPPAWLSITENKKLASQIHIWTPGFLAAGPLILWIWTSSVNWMKLNDFHHMTAPKANHGWANFVMDKPWPGHYGSRMRCSDHVGPYIRGK